MRAIRFLLALCLLLSPLSAAATPRIGVMTMQPGEVFWERFGHDAIVVEDPARGEALSYNYGFFDPSEPGFLGRFVRGEMQYMLVALPLAQDLQYYREVGRGASIQWLDLDPAQARGLAAELAENAKPENARYRYDYYTDNCTTRVRDALDKALGGVLESGLEARTGGMTYRQQTVRLMSAQPWLMLVLDLGLGPYADRPLNAWQESFLPEVLQAQLREVRIDDGHGNLQPLVQSEQLLSPNRLDVPPPAAPDLRPPLAAAGLLLAALIVIGRRWWPAGYALLGTLYLIAAGLVGLLLLVLWTLTTHHSAWANANLLLFNPLAFLLLPTLWRSRRGFAASRFIDGVIALQLLACMVALLLHLLPGTVQQNQPWLLFALPCWLALAWSMRRHRR